MAIRMSPSSIPRLRFRLTNTAEQIVRGGHPWVYGDSLHEQNRDGVSGEIGVVYDKSDRFLALGFYDPESPIRLRILHVGKPVIVDAAFWRSRLASSLQRRAGLFGPETTGYRCINGESDGWPGLVLDRYGETYVVKLYATAWLASAAWISARIEQTQPPMGLDLRALFQTLTSAKRIVFRLSRNLMPAANRLGLTDGQEMLSCEETSNKQTPTVEFLEDNITFEAEVNRGQKTGFFLDQRENRRRIATLTAGGEVLNAFSFSGGFSLHAARGGARRVIDLDISPIALESARRNFALNQKHPKIAVAHHDQIQADAFDWLATGPRRAFDCVICDPPSLAKRESDRAGAIQAYGRLASSSISRVRSGGILFAASCSAHVSSEEFFSTVRRAVQLSGRKSEELATTHHAPDHPATFEEAKYLKGIYFRLS